ncbi:MAG: Arc family DNA-binding protein [Tenuifilaceae bacterium]
MSSKKSFVIRINPEKLEAVEKWAADEFRSTNGQLEWIIEQALKKAGRYKKNESLESNTDNENDKI